MRPGRFTEEQITIGILRDMRPSILSSLPSDSSLVSPTALPTACLTAPLIYFADPTIRSLSDFFLRYFS